MFFGNSNFLQALGWAVLNSLWQMAFLWVIFQSVLSFGLRRPASRAKLATILLNTGFGWFLYTLVFHWLIDPHAVKSSLLSFGSFYFADSNWNAQLQNILPFASSAYLLLLTIPTFQFIRNYRFVQTIRTSGLSKCNVDFRIFVQRFAQRIGIRKRVHVYISELITSPVTIGFVKPIILMPIAAITNLSTKQVEAILLHELAHIRRYDYFINLLINFIRTILYFNPFVKLFAKTIERERERSCDEIVMQFEYDPHGYASALLTLERNNFMRPTIAVAASGQRKDLLHRIERILGIEKRKFPDFQKLSGLLAGLVCVIAFNAVFFFSSPVIQSRSFAFTAFSNPFYQLVSDGKELPAGDKRVADKQKFNTAEVTKQPVQQNKETAHLVQVPVDRQGQFVYSMPEMKDGLTIADDIMHFEPTLKNSERAQVKEVVAATRKVLEDGEWKQMEKNIADVLTEAEKERVKQKYLSKVDKVNWNKLEERLKLEYDQINWDNVNAKLDFAITNIKLDSLNTACNIALSNLDKAQSWMTENQVQSIPDTDVKLQEIKVQKEQVENQIKKIRAIRLRKIVHL